MATTRKRGRPRKQRIMLGTRIIPFESLSDEQAENCKPAGLYREYLKNNPQVHDVGGHFGEWLTAIAVAIEAGDAVRTGWYAYQALQYRAMLAVDEPVEIKPVESATLDLLVEAHSTSELAKNNKIKRSDLVQIGLAELHSDKRKGNRGRW